MATAYATLKMNGKEYVLVPKAIFRRISAEDLRDARKATQALAKYRAGQLATVSHESLKRSLGL